MMADNWKHVACSRLKNVYYLGFSGRQWHRFHIDKELELLRVKICYATFGLPIKAQTEAIDDATIEEAYTEEQKIKAQQIIDNILKVERDEGSSLTIAVGFAFVVCHQKNNQQEVKVENKCTDYCVPVFSVLVGTKNDKDKRNFVDTQGRIYKSWDDWKSNNLLPKVEIAYPRNGYFTCNNDGSYGFDSEKDPIIDFGESSQCSAWSKVKKVGDAASTVTSLGEFAGSLWPACSCNAGC